jgi:small subunit ribosomal protein S3
MGQKVHPEGLRVGYIHDWKSNWFNERQFADFLDEDTQIRKHIIGRLSHAGLSDITIRKNQNEVEVNINTARPGIVIGKSGSEVDQLRRDLHRITGKQVKVNILEIKRPELDARLVAQSIAEQLQNRVAFRRAMKRALTSAMRSGAKGVKVQVSGRLGGAEMARTEGYSDGRVPLHTLRADIDYGFHEARTTFGRIGVKCWINKGEIMPEGYTGADLTIMDEPAPQAPERDGRRGGRDGRSGGGGGRGGGGGGRGGGPGGRGGPGGSGPGGGRGPGGPGRGGGGGGRGGGPGGGGGRGGGGGGGGGRPGGGGGGGGRGPGGPGGGRGPGGPGGGGGRPGGGGGGGGRGPGGPGGGRGPGGGGGGGRPGGGGGRGPGGPGGGGGGGRPGGGGGGSRQSSGGGGS